MGKKEKKADAIVEEDTEVLTTQDEGKVPNAPEATGNLNAAIVDEYGPKVKVVTEKETEVIANGDVGNIAEIIEDHTMDKAEDGVLTKNEEINKFGIDVPTVKNPMGTHDGLESELVTSEVHAMKQLAWQNKQLRGAIVYLVKSLMTPADLEDFKTLFPGLM